MKKLVIWGASSQALLVADVIRLVGEYEVVGFLDSVNPDLAGTEFCGARVLGGEEQLDGLFQQGVKHVVFGIGINRVRLQLAELVRAKGFELATAIHPAAVVANGVPIGAGSFLMAGSVVNPAATIGENVVICTCASVEHECVIEDGALISAGAHLGGRTIVERAATVEIGATVARRLRIGAGSVVGAGAVVLHDVPNDVLVYGAPARVIRKIEGYEY